MCIRDSDTGASEGKVDTYMDAAVAEVPVGDTPQSMLGQEVFEPPQVGAQLVDRDGCVLPSGVCRFAVPVDQLGSYLRGFEDLLTSMDWVVSPTGTSATAASMYV